MTDRSPAFSFIDNPFNHLQLGKLDSNVLLFEPLDPLSDDSLSHCDAISRSSSSSPSSPQPHPEFLTHEPSMFHVGPLEPLSNSMPLGMSSSDALVKLEPVGIFNINTKKRTHTSINSSKSLNTYNHNIISHDHISVDDTKEPVVTSSSTAAPTSPTSPLSSSSSSDDFTADGVDSADASPSGGKTGGREADSKRKRLARKAALARESRKRKKSRLAEMEAEVERLRDELQRARTAHGLAPLPPLPPPIAIVPPSVASSSSICASPTPSFAGHISIDDSITSSSAVSSNGVVASTGMVKLEVLPSPCSSPLPLPHVMEPIGIATAVPSVESTIVPTHVSEPIVVSSSSASLAQQISMSSDNDQIALNHAMQQVIASGGVAQAAATSLAVLVTPSVDGTSSTATSSDTTAAAVAVATANHQLEQHIESLLSICERKSVTAEAHLSSLDQLLAPCLPLRFLEWFLTQKDSFYGDSGLWHTLARQILSLSTEQMSLLLALRQDIMTQRAVETELRLTAAGICANMVPSSTTPVMSMSSTLSLQHVYASLSSLSRLHMNHSNKNMTTLRAILTPLQLAKFFEWVNHYGAICIQINI